MTRKTIYLILIILSCSCNEKKYVKNSNQSTDTIVNLEKHVTPIFLGLSPHMSSEVFNKTLLSKEKEGFLINNIFKINIRGKEYGFNLSQINNYISLQYNGINEISFDNLNSEKSENLITVSKNSLQALIAEYELKYDLLSQPLPLPFKENKNHEYSISSIWQNGKCEFSPSIYGLRYNHYKIFKDSIKTILIGYETFGKIIPSDKEIKTRIDYSKITKIPEEYFSKSGSISEQLRNRQKISGYGNFDKASLELAIRENNPELNFQKFGFVVDILYFHNEDFDNILKQIKKDYNEFQLRLSSRDSLKDLNEKNIRRNNDEL